MPDTNTALADAVSTNGAHAQRTDEKPSGSENSLPTPAKPTLKPRRRTPPPPRRRTDKPALQGERVAFFVTDAGDLDSDRVTDETIARLQKAISSPQAKRRLGLVTETGEPAAARTWGALTGQLVDSLNALIATAAQNAWQLTDDQATLIMLRRDPETHQRVAVLTGELLDKYFPGGFGEYDKELSLLILLGGFAMKTVAEIRATMPTTPTEVLTFPQASTAAN